MSNGAIIEGPYRYRLWREWSEGPRACFIMLNPSTADATEDDPTIRRCVGFAKAWGCGRLEVVNLFALRATDPAALAKHPAPVGPANMTHITSAAAGASHVVCAWGAHPFALRRADDTLAMLVRHGIEATALKLTRGGRPAHPLYLPAGLKPIALSQWATT